MSFSLKNHKNGLWSGHFSLLEQEKLVHGISTRFGGVSLGEYASLNLALHNGDEKDLVIENRRRFCQAHGVELRDVCTCEQVHGSKIIRVDEKDRGAGAFSFDTAIKETDALITNQKNIPLLLFFADCTPVLFFDPVHRAIGAAHAGWKGTVAKIARKTLQRMTDEFGTRAEDCLITIGPSIGGCCYEVDAAVMERFAEAFPEDTSKIITALPENKWKIDLWQANYLQLRTAGVPAEKIEMAEACTQCNHEVFFSYRADQGKTGRIAAMISLK